MPLPTFLGLGAQKAGTSWLAQQLSTHPDVFLPAISETHYFDRNFERGADFYKGLFKPSKAIGEITPAYMFKPGIPERIAATLGKNIKFLILLRHPTDRLYSQYKMACVQNARLVDFDSFSKEGENSFKIGLYINHLDRYFKIFPKENFLIHIYEEIFENATTRRKALADVANHIGVSPMLFRHEDQSKVINSGEGLPRFPWLYKYGLRAVDLLRRHRIDQPVSLLKKSGLRDILFPPVKDIPAISASQQERLERLYAPSIARLEECLGRPLWRDSGLAFPAASGHSLKS